MNWLYYYIDLLVNCFARSREYIICLISFNKFSAVLHYLACASAIDNLWSIRVGVNILSRTAKFEGGTLPCFALYLASDSKKQ